MTEPLAFLAQARSDFRVFQFLEEEDRAQVPECHALHYHQMATEKLAKAALLSAGVTFDKFGHVAFSHLPHQLNRRDVASKLGWKNYRAYKSFLKRAAPLFREIDELNPAVGPRAVGADAPSGVNVEYPWPGRAPSGASVWHAPVFHDFGLLERFRRLPEARQVVVFISSLLDRFSVVFP